MKSMKNMKNMKNPISTFAPSPVFHFTSLLFSPKKSPRNHPKFCPPSPSRSKILPFFFLSLLLSFSILGFFTLSFFIPQHSLPFSLISHSSSLPLLPTLFTSFTSKLSGFVDNDDDSGGSGMAKSVMVPIPSHQVFGNVSREEKEFWEQPDGEGYKPCLDFSLEYRKANARISKEKRRFLIVVVSGGLNQQRNQIVDAVVIARILEAALVVPVLQVNLIWADESEFSDIFDVQHFKRTLRSDVRIVSSLPSTHLRSTQSIENQIPQEVSPFWIRARYSRQLNEEGLLILKGLDSKLSKNLPADLQKLRCKVAFHALRFAAPIEELGNRLSRRMWIEGPYIALHLRLEKDIWVRSGCLTGLGHEYDKIITEIRDSQPEFLTGKLNMDNIQRRLAGLCPLRASEMARFLKALGAPTHAQVFVAGGEPFGGTKAMQPLLAEFPNVVTRDMLARKEELSPYVKKSSVLAAIDYIISLNSNVFIPSHGGNMGRIMQGHRAYVGHRKYIRPNKRSMIPLFDNSSIPAAEFESMIRMLHRKSQGQPETRTKKRDRDVIAYPVPECMCRHSTAIF